MKTICSTLATIALLFSMPALASNLAEKAGDKPGDKAPKETKQAPAKDKVTIEKGSPKGKSPICGDAG